MYQVIVMVKDKPHAFPVLLQSRTTALDMGRLLIDNKEVIGVNISEVVGEDTVLRYCMWRNNVDATMYTLMTVATDERGNAHDTDTVVLPLHP
jgi:hypothetical protein